MVQDSGIEGLGHIWLVLVLLGPLVFLGIN